jgi:hypothetical protein
MKIINHGEWEAYVPDPRPEELPANILFCRRKSDGVDWYEYQKKLTDKAVYCVVLNGKINPVFRDPSMLFPQYGTVLEIVDKDTVEIIAEYAGRKYDPETNTLV